MLDDVIDVDVVSPCTRIWKLKWIWRNRSRLGGVEVDLVELKWNWRKWSGVGEVEVDLAKLKWIQWSWSWVCEVELDLAKTKTRSRNLKCVHEILSAGGREINYAANRISSKNQNQRQKLRYVDWRIWMGESFEELLEVTEINGFGSKSWFWLGRCSGQELNIKFAINGSILDKHRIWLYL